MLGRQLEAYEGQPARQAKTLARMDRVVRLLSAWPLITLDEIADHEGWPAQNTLYVLVALMLDGRVARCRASELKRGNIGVATHAWLYVAVQRAVQRLRVA